MQGGAEACGNAKILLSMTFKCVDFNAGRGRSLQQCRNLAFNDLYAREFQCREGQKPPIWQNSRSQRQKGQPHETNVRLPFIFMRTSPAPPRREGASGHLYSPSRQEGRSPGPQAVCQLSCCRCSRRTGHPARSRARGHPPEGGCPGELAE